MAYQNYFPVTYQPNYYGNPNPFYQQNYQQNYQQAQQAQQQAQAQQPAIQQSGFVLVQSEQDARSYPVAPGNSITFKDERQPYCYVKTMGFNQLDQPMFEKYRLVKEENAETAQNLRSDDANENAVKDTSYALKRDIDEIWGEIDGIKEKMKANGYKKPKKTKLLEDEEDDE